MAAHVERDVQAWPAEGAIERLERLDRLDRQDRRDREEARERQEAARSAAAAAAALHAQGAPDRMVAAGAALLKELVGMGQGHLVDGWQPGEDEEDKRRLFLQLHALDASITGGLVGYVRRAATLLKESLSLTLTPPLTLTLTLTLTLMLTLTLSLAVAVAVALTLTRRVRRARTRSRGSRPQSPPGTSCS